MDNKKIPTCIGTIILVIIAITVGIFVWTYEKGQDLYVDIESKIVLKPVVKSNEQRVTGAEKSTTLTINDGLYKNIKYNYQLEIPDNLKLESGSVDNPDSLIRLLSSQSNQPLFSIYVENSNSKNIDDWLSKYRQKISTMTSYEGVPVDPPMILSTKKISIDSITAIGVVIKNMPYSDYFIVFIKNGLVYTISYSGLLEKDENELLNSKSEEYIEYNNLLLEFHLKHRVELDKIVESFKFMQQ